MIGNPGTSSERCEPMQGTGQSSILILPYVSSQKLRCGPLLVPCRLQAVTNASRRPATRMQSMSLRTAISNSRSLCRKFFSHEPPMRISNHVSSARKMKNRKHKRATDASRGATRPTRSTKGARNERVVMLAAWSFP